MLCDQFYVHLVNVMLQMCVETLLMSHLHHMCVAAAIMAALLWPVCAECNRIPILVKPDRLQKCVKAAVILWDFKCLQQIRSCLLISFNAKTYQAA